MAVYGDERGKKLIWRYRKTITLPDGSKMRIAGKPNINTKVAAEKAEREHIQRLQSPAPPPKKEVPTLDEFSKTFLEQARARNKPSSVESKESTLRIHLSPIFGSMKLDKIGVGEIQDYVAEKVKPAKMKKDPKPLSRKTVNNHLSVLHSLLSVARKRGHINAVPEFEWLKSPKPDFDFLTFDEATRLVKAVDDEEWARMVIVALKTGLRLGELLALRWEDVDLPRHLLRVRQSAARGIVTTPKSGKGREIPLGDEVLKAFHQQRHLRGPFVFCNLDGRMWTKNECKAPLRRAFKAAGLRKVKWHMLRHTFASHLIMRGAPLKALQELLGHATIDMTMRYAHLSPDVPRDTVKLLDGVTTG